MATWAGGHGHMAQTGVAGSASWWSCAVGGRTASSRGVRTRRRPRGPAPGCPGVHSQPTASTSPACRNSEHPPPYPPAPLPIIGRSRWSPRFACLSSREDPLVLVPQRPAGSHRWPAGTPPALTLWTARWLRVPANPIGGLAGRPTTHRLSDTLQRRGRRAAWTKPPPRRVPLGLQEGWSRQSAESRQPNVSCC
jgi:hypothetical protein